MSKPKAAMGWNPSSHQEGKEGEEMKEIDRERDRQKERVKSEKLGLLPSFFGRREQKRWSRIPMQCL